MREMYTTVQFGQLRKKMSLEPLKSQSFHMRFLGNPGTGKTVVARIVGKLLVQLGAIEKPSKSPSRNHYGKPKDEEPIFNEVSRADLVAEYVGQTANKTTDWVKRSLGGVFFLDEAYALVQGEKDSFGQEAVDTLIKEMEDKRKQVIVIVAGYPNEMETFFNTNPGFKSRVPFTFHFEDYTCNELSEIGKLMLNKKRLVMPRSLITYSHAVRFSTGCCDRLEDCDESKDKGNGRAVRNAVEAGIRAMARRLADDNQTATTELYSTLKEEDFSAVTTQMIDTRLNFPCGAYGDLQKLTNSITEESNSILSDLPSERPDLLGKIKQLVADTTLIDSLEGLDDLSMALGGQCDAKLSDLRAALIEKIQKTCSPGDNNLLSYIGEALQKEDNPASVQAYVRMLTAAVDDQAFMRQVLAVLLRPAERAEGSEFSELEKDCEQRVSSIESRKYMVPFTFFTS
jgi:stage V sporulation protein K